MNIIIIETNSILDLENFNLIKMYMYTLIGIMNKIKNVTIITKI